MTLNCLDDLNNYKSTCAIDDVAIAKVVPSVNLLTKQPEQIHIEKLRTGTSVASVTALGLVTESQAPSKTARRTFFLSPRVKHHKNPVFHTHLLLDLCPKK